MVFKSAGERFPAVAPNARQLPYAVKLAGWDLAGGLLTYGGGLCLSLFVAAVVVHAFRRSFALEALYGLAALGCAVFCAQSLWLLGSPYIVFHADRLEKRELFGWRRSPGSTSLESARRSAAATAPTSWSIPDPARAG